jgi:hypothetical protein
VSWWWTSIWGSGCHAGEHVSQVTAKVPEKEQGPLVRLLRVEPVRLPILDLLRDLDRRMVGVYSAIEDERGGVPSEAISDIRRGRQRPWSIDGKRALEAFAARSPWAQIEPIGGEWYRWLKHVQDVRTRLTGIFYQSAPTRRRRSSCRTRPRRVVA